MMKTVFAVLIGLCSTFTPHFVHADGKRAIGIAMQRSGDSLRIAVYQPKNIYSAQAAKYAATPGQIVTGKLYQPYTDRNHRFSIRGAFNMPQKANGLCKVIRDHMGGSTIATCKLRTLMGPPNAPKTFEVLLDRPTRYSLSRKARAGDIVPVQFDINDLSNIRGIRFYKPIKPVYNHR